MLDIKKRDFTTTSWLETLPTEILVRIFKYQGIQENILGIGLVRRRFHLIITTCPELWSTPESSVEFSVESFKHIMIHARNFKVLALKYSQKAVRYNSPNTFIEGHLSSCTNIEELDLFYNTCIVDLTFVQSMPVLKKLTVEGCTSIPPENMLNTLKKCKALKVLDVSNCLQLDGDHQIAGLVEICLILPLLQIFKAEWSCRFSPELVHDILDSSQDLSYLAVTPSF